MLGVQSPGAEGVQGVHVHHGLELLIVPDLHLFDLVGGAEAIEEVQEGHAAADGSQVGHSAQVHNLLGVVAAEHGVARGAAGHDVTVVAENGQGVGGQGPGRDMGHPGQQAAGDLIHVGDHQQQALGGGKGGGQGPRSQGAVDRAGSAALGLHHRDLYRLAEHVLAPLGRPLVRQFRHHRGWGDGIDCRNFRKRVGHVCRCGVAVHCFAGSCHGNSSFSQKQMACRSCHAAGRFHMFRKWAMLHTAQRSCLTC